MYSTTNNTNTTAAAPPSYQDTVADRGYDGPFIPDDFNYSTKVFSCELPVRAHFINRVMNILSLQLCTTLFSILLAFQNTTFHNFMINHMGLFYISMIVSLITCFWLSLMPRLENYGDASNEEIPWYVYGKRGQYVLLGVFTMAESWMVTLFTLSYRYEIVLRAIVVTTILVLGISILSRFDRLAFLVESNSSIYYWLNCSLWIMIGLGMSSFFIPWNNTWDLVYGWGGAILFSIYLLIDLQLVLRKVYCDEEIRCAMMIYLDIINLFLSILRIMSHTSDD
ncbi:bax inhibitor 1 [Monosporozyma servazzii]